jgi:hypothetical protein
MSDEHLDELYDIIKEEINNLDLEDIALERLNENNIVEYWNFVYKYDFYDKAKIKSKIYKYVRDNKVRLEMDDNLISNQVLLHNTCINRSKYCETTNEAAKKGHLECLTYLHENGSTWDADTCAYAAENGSDAKQARLALCERELLERSSNNPIHSHLECLKYAHENGCPWDEDTCMHAAWKGQLECLKYAHENGCKWNANTCTYAAENGNLECLRYAHENGCKWNANTCTYAAWKGQLECLKYAHENGCKWNELTCSSAANNGHLECLKYAHVNGCPWDECTCSNAAREGHLKCLKYAHENGCPWDERTCSNAAREGHLECLKYAHENGCEWNDV